jgi:DNA-binding IclR family transcriptional regulator
MTEVAALDKNIQIPQGLEKTVEFLQFCKWSAQPKDVREPKEQQELALELGVDKATLSIWKQNPEFAHNIRHYVKEFIGNDFPQLMHAVKKRAMNHSTADSKLLLEWLGEIASGTQVAVQVNNITPPSPQALYEEALEVVADHYKISVAELTAKL